MTQNVKEGAYLVEFCQEFVAVKRLEKVDQICFVVEQVSSKIFFSVPNSLLFLGVNQLFE